jgi:hypothetical protein
MIQQAETITNQRLISEFESGRVPGEFHHKDHVRVAFAYVIELPLPEAIARFSAALQRFAAARGKANLYHATITWAYMFLIAERIAQTGLGQSWEEFAAGNGDLLIWRGGVLEQYYSKERLSSDLARDMFVLPDRLAQT